MRGGTGGKFLAGTGGSARATPLVDTGDGGGGNDGGVSRGAAEATRVT